MSRYLRAPLAIMVANLVTVLFLLVGPGGTSYAASVPDKLALEGIDTITINASTGANSPAECGTSAGVVRTAVTGRVVPTGLRPADGAPLVANASTATLYFEKQRLCISSVTLRIGLFAFYYTDPATKKERLGEVALVNKSGMLTSDAATHPQQITALVHRMLDEFLLDWREANLVAQLSKIGPAAGGDRGGLVKDERTANAQRRLQELGLYGGAIDGVFGQGTAKAITSFQKARGLQVTGELDEPTVISLSE